MSQQKHHKSLNEAIRRIPLPRYWRSLNHGHLLEHHSSLHYHRLFSAHSFIARRPEVDFSLSFHLAKTSPPSAWTRSTLFSQTRNLRFTLFPAYFSSPCFFIPSDQHSHPQERQTGPRSRSPRFIERFRDGNRFLARRQFAKNRGEFGQHERPARVFPRPPAALLPLCA